MSHNDGIETLVALRQRIEHILHAHGLQAQWTGFSVSDSAAGPHEVRILTSLTGPDDDRFEEVIAGARQAEIEQLHQLFTNNDT